jgi:hemoglobin
MRIPGFVMSALLALAACGGKSSTGDTTSNSGSAAALDNRPLFERLGGQEAINAVVHLFVEKTGNDPRIAEFFINVDKAKLEASMDEHICSITGGPCEYKGKSMKESHTGMKVRTEHFEYFMEDLEAVLVEAKVGDREKGEVLAAFRSMQADVVEPAE